MRILHETLNPWCLYK